MCRWRSRFRSCSQVATWGMRTSEAQAVHAVLPRGTVLSSLVKPELQWLLAFNKRSLEISTPATQQADSVATDRRDSTVLLQFRQPVGYMEGHDPWPLDRPARHQGAHVQHCSAQRAGMARKEGHSQAHQVRAYQNTSASHCSFQTYSMSAACSCRACRRAGAPPHGFAHSLQVHDTSRNHVWEVNSLSRSRLEAIKLT